MATLLTALLSIIGHISYSNFVWHQHTCNTSGDGRNTKLTGRDLPTIIEISQLPDTKAPAVLLRLSFQMKYFRVTLRHFSRLRIMPPPIPGMGFAVCAAISCSPSVHFSFILCKFHPVQVQENLFVDVTN